MEKKIHKFSFIRFILCIFLAFVVGVPFYAVCPQPVIAYAETTNDFDSTSVNEDLGEELLIEYAAKALVDLEKEPALYNFTEYCYSNNANVRNSLYGLYFYVYNPSRTAYVTRLGANTISMAVAYDENGAPTDYANLRLKYCGQSTGDYHGLFYKFRVMDVEDVLAHAVVCDDAGNKRRYDIAGIQLYSDSSLANKQVSVFDYGVNLKYYFSGYSKGCYTMNPGESTLKVECFPLETLKLDVFNTFFRTGEYEKGYKHDLTSVYFAVPNRFFDDYGNLQKIKAEWYEYVTTPICVTSNNTVYNALYPFLGEYTNESDGNLLQLYTGYQKVTTGSGHKDKYDWAYNCDYTSLINESCKRISYLFSTEGKSVSNYVVTDERLKDYVEKYDKTFKDGYVNIPNHQISHDLFEKELSTSRASVPYVDEDIHHKLVDFDAAESFNLLNYDDTHSGWNKFFAKCFGLYPSETGESFRGISPIHVVSKKDMDMDTWNSNLFIHDLDKEHFKAFYDDATSNNKTVVLFRFAQTDYMDLSVIAYKSGDNLSGNYGADTHIVSETVFYNFDIITLTFQKQGVDKVIPVVASPIDIYNDITLTKSPPVGCTNFKWWEILVFLLVLVLLWPILLPILQWLLPLIGNGIVWLIKAPFRFIRWLVDVFSGGDDG